MRTQNDSNTKQTFTVIAIVLISIFWMSIRVAVANDVPEWTQEDHRTQGAGWIWFPANAVAPTEIEADLMAKGKAIAYLMDECQIPHKEIRFNERFVQENDGKFKVYVRASITDRQCGEGKYGSRELKAKIVNTRLLDVYRQYQTRLAELRIANTVCRASSTYCLEQAIKSFDMQNYYLAYTYAEKACQSGLKSACKSVNTIRAFIVSNDK